MVQIYSPSNEIHELQDAFRRMVNEAIRRGIESNISSKFKLIKEVYPDFKNGLHTHYILTACEKAASMLKNYRRENQRMRKIYWIPVRFLTVLDR